MLIIGIDPGISGSICFFQDGKIIDVVEMPTMTEGKKNKKQVNGSQIFNEISDRIRKLDKRDIKEIIEQVSAMPGQGVTSMFNFGQSFGILKGICSAMQLPMYFVRPAKWKKYFNLINSEKDASRTRAIEIFPYFSGQLSRKKDSNKADAILIASFYYETYKIEEQKKNTRQIHDTFKCEVLNMEADIASQAVGLGTNTDFSLISLFLRADIIVKSVIIILIVCSIYSWAVIIDKFRLFKKINKSSDDFEEKFWDSKSAETFYNSLPAKVDDPMAIVFKDTMESLLKKKFKSNLSEKMSTFLEVGIEKQMSKIDKGFTFLATVGSTAPFIGLFGTVWGIMNSFQSIAISRNTSLAIVAPGIAEALFATALGLLAAIPAVVAYNKFNTDSQKYSQKLENFSKRFLTII